jgi:very-short-patch-repair endonuclease
MGEPTHLAVRRCQTLALRQHGIITRNQALELGMTRAAIGRRLTSGEWIHLLPQTFALRGSPATFMRKVVAAYYWAGEGALISHRTSGRLFDLDGVDARAIEVSTPRRLRSDRVIVHTRNTEVFPSRRIGLVQSTSIEQTLLDLGSVLELEALELALDSALRMGHTRFDRVAKHVAELGGHGVPGSKRLKRILQLREPTPRPTHSILEVEFVHLTRDFRLPRAESQFPIELRAGLTIHVDFAYPIEKLAIEIDSVRWHSGVRAIRWDNERQNLLVALGWRVLRFEWNDVLLRPEWVAAQIVAALTEGQISLPLH